MAGRIAIMGNEPYAGWIERDDQAQRLFKAYCYKWPDGDAQCVAIGDEFYVRFDNGEMRHVHSLADFDGEDEWCAQCGTPIDPDSSEYYFCDVFGCDAVLCENCGNSQECDGYYCPRHRGAEAFLDAKEPSYVYPYAFGGGNRFTYGVEIELESELSDDFAENVTNSDVIAGWDKDASLERNGVELQSNILNMFQTARIATDCGGHPGVWRERWRAHPRGAHGQPMRKPLVLGATWTGRGPMPTTQHAPSRRRLLVLAHSWRVYR